jgi:predicted DNA-binding protein
MPDAMQRYSLSLDEKTYKQIKIVAKREGRTIANMMRRLIDEALAARGERVDP